MSPQTQSTDTPNLTARERRPFNIVHAPRAWAHSVRIPLSRKAALLILADARGPDGVTWQDQLSIAETAGVALSCLRAQLKHLETTGHLVRYRRHRPNGSHSSDLVVLTMPREKPLRISDYDGMGGRRIGARIGKLEPPEHAKILEDLTPESGQAESGQAERAPNARIPSSLTPESGHPTDPEGRPGGTKRPVGTPSSSNNNARASANERPAAADHLEIVEEGIDRRTCSPEDLAADNLLDAYDCENA